MPNLLGLAIQSTAAIAVTLFVYRSMPRWRADIWTMGIASALLASGIVIGTKLALWGVTPTFKLELLVSTAIALVAAATTLFALALFAKR